MDTNTPTVNSLKDKLAYYQSEEGKKQIAEWKQKHEAILKKYKIRVDGNVLSEEEIEKGEPKQRATLEAYLIDFTYPADFKTTFDFIDKYFPELIAKAKSMSFKDSMSTKNRVTVMNNLKKWWFGYLQARMEESY